MTTSRARTALLLALLAAPLVACGTSTPAPAAPSAPTTSSVPAPSALPARPAELRLNGIDPCELLAPVQAEQLNLGDGNPDANYDGLGTLACSWSGRGLKPTNIWTAKAIVKQGAEYFLGSVTGTEVVQAGDFPAVQTTAPDVDPAKHCVLYVDVAPGQTLAVAYSNPRDDYPGMNHQVACQLTDRMARLLLDTLRTRRPS